MRTSFIIRMVNGALGGVGLACPGTTPHHEALYAPTTDSPPAPHVASQPILDSATSL